ncbi:MAG: SH3 beta-barrel fold-containing protein [Bacteroidia bacterium]
MGTRSLTFVYDDNGTPIINLYRQFDGYREGHGQELADFLNSIDEVVNGLTLGEKRRVANGMGCLAAQLVAHFKLGEGGFYLYPTTTKDCWQDYEYHVYEKHVIVKDPDTTIFKGTWHQFYDWAHIDTAQDWSTDQGRASLKDLLQKQIVEVSFIKADGSTRDMRCTLLEDYITPTTKTTTRTKAPSDETMAVWDVDANGWRSFRFDSIEDVRV